MAATSSAAAAAGAEAVDLLSPQARKLWAAYQGASSTLGESLRDLGFVDLVVYGRQTTGKSSLLGALCGVQLPTGENQITKCPIRISVNPNQQGATLTAAGNPPQPMDGNHLSAEMYKSALDLLSRGRVTHQEMSISLGSKNHPPLNLVDLPGLIPNTGEATSSEVEKMVKDTLQNPATLPIIVLRAESDELATVRTELTGGKKFYAVATHLDLYDPERDVGRLVELATKFKEVGCLGLFLVSVKGSADKPETWYDEFCSRCPDAALKDKLRKMCGVGSLRTELQQVQLNHMLLNHPAITANISRLLLQVTAKMDSAPKDEEALFGAMHQSLGQIGQDLSDAVERGAWSVGSDEAMTHHKHRLRDRGPSAAAPEDAASVQSSGNHLHAEVRQQEAHQVLRDFASRAEEQVLASLVEGWASVDPDVIMNPSQLASEQTLAWNLMKPGLARLRHEAEAAAVRLLALQKSFLVWRSEKHLSHLGNMVSHAFSLFVDEYHTQKSAALGQILDHADESFKVVPPEVYSPAVYHAMLETPSTVDSVKKYSKPLAKALEATNDMSRGHQPEFYEDKFQEQWTNLQRKSKLLAFQVASETINSLSSKLWYIIFVRSCRYMSMQPWQTSLAYAPLQPAFTRWVDHESHDMSAWVDPEQQVLAQERESLTAILAELKPFEMHAATLSPAPMQLPKKAAEQELSAEKEPSMSASQASYKPAENANGYGNGNYGNGGYDPTGSAGQGSDKPANGGYSTSQFSTGTQASPQYNGNPKTIPEGSERAPRTPETAPTTPASPYSPSQLESQGSYPESGSASDRKKSTNLMNKFRMPSSMRAKSRDLGDKNGADL